ncbi:MAG: ECF transporter S component [Firmicutes bacterium]|nr:ECF transporter S component [Clostridiales bacterium]MBQ3123490.1 ECF transporter S component [Bacillota bacterium]
MRQKVYRLVVAAMMGCASFILIFFNFGVPFLSPFAEFDLSALPELIGGFVLGPVGAIEIITVKLLLKLVFQGSSSMLTGEIQNFLLSVTYVLPAVLYYRKHRTKKGAVIGLVLGSVLSIITAIITNIYLIFPAYMFLYGMDWDMIVGMFSAVNPYIKNIPTVVAFSIVPFNVISRTVTSVITFFVYKKISKPLKKIISEADNK